MSIDSPITHLHEQDEAAFIPFGDQVRIVGQHGYVEIEYAATRKAVALMDCPQRALIRLTGKDRADFLHRMISNDVNGLAIGSSNQALLLNVKGRIIADMRVLAGEDAHWLDLSVHAAETVCADLDKMLFSEKVKIENLTQEWHRLSLHGPKAAALLDRLASTTFIEPEDQTHRLLILGGIEVLVHRCDETGVCGFHLWLPTKHIEKLWSDLRAAGESDGLKVLGWLAYNIARIEAGTPLFHVDFGQTNLAHETGIVNTYCSFTKGCYRGQEIVARMQSLGHPKQLLVGFEADGKDVPVAGNGIFADNTPDAPTIGAVTSSTFSPMLSHKAIGFAMVKWSHHTPGKTLYAPAEGKTIPITVTELRHVK